eukprot:TRINITY_DN20012_c0_g1_i1.p1 TRINITY_DN20012_c0_g1~~TRINITY_DN20012_c0_g1_i1.p1  ORF type:complete len:431 (+),score=91.78 TRINITY_DN20012_c0_g1_i1:73-1365(+)
MPVTPGSVRPGVPQEGAVLQEELRKRLHGVRQGVHMRMERVERSLVEDIEVAGAVNDWMGTPTALEQGIGVKGPSANTLRSVGEILSGDLCDLCGMNRDEASFCPLTGKLHRKPVTRFEAERRKLLNGETAVSREEGTQTYVQLDELRTADSLGVALNVGGYILVRPETDVRRHCLTGTAPWHDAMAKYCGGNKVGRVVFAKPQCTTADVTFPDGESWLFPVAALLPYNIPSNLNMMERYPVLPDPTADAQEDLFIKSLQAKLRERELETRTAELQMRYIELYIETYKEEKRSRQKLQVAFNELKQVTQLQAFQAPNPRKPWPVEDTHRVPKVSPAGPMPVLQHNKTLASQPVAAVPWNNRGGGWDVMGVTEEGHYIFKENFPAPPPQPAHIPPTILTTEGRGRSPVLSQQGPQTPIVMPKEIARKQSLL